MNESITRAAGTEHGQEFDPEEMESPDRNGGWDANPECGILCIKMLGEKGKTLHI